MVDGKKCLCKGKPDCFLGEKDSEWLRIEFERFPYADTCYARNSHAELLMWNEPDYKGTSY